MISGVITLPAPGAAPAGRVDQDPAATPLDGDAFSALIEDALVAAPPGVPPSPAATVMGVLHAAVVNEWCLCWPAVPVTVPTVPEGESNVEDIPESADSADGEHDPVGDGALNLEWLQLPQIFRPDGAPAPTDGNRTAEPAQPPSAGASSAGVAPLLIPVSSTQPHRQAPDLPTDLEAAASIDVIEPAEKAMPRFDRLRGESSVPSSDAAWAIERATAMTDGASIADAVQVHASFDEGRSMSSAQQEHGSAPEAAAARTQTSTSNVAFGVNAAVPNPLPGAAAATPPAASLMAERQTPDAESLQDLVQTMRVQVRQGIGDAVVRLKPEHLGEISIRLHVEQQNVSAVIRAEVPAVRQWLEQNEASLRQNLSQHGLQLDKFVVREDESRREPSDSREELQDRRERRRPHSRQHEPEPRFELLV